MACSIFPSVGRTDRRPVTSPSPPVRLAPFALALCTLGLPLRPATAQPQHDALFIEAGGPGGAVTISYERAFGRVSPRLGVGATPFSAPCACPRDVSVQRRAWPVRGGRRGRLRPLRVGRRDCLGCLASRDVRLPARPRGRPARPPRRVHADLDSGRRDHAVVRSRRRRELRPAARAPLIGAGAQRFRLDLVSTNFHRRRVTKGSPLPSAYFFRSPCRSTGYTSGCPRWMTLRSTR